MLQLNRCRGEAGIRRYVGGKAYDEQLGVDDKVEDSSSDRLGFHVWIQHMQMVIEGMEVKNQVCREDSAVNG